jgi:hypothetical protein
MQGWRLDSAQDRRFGCGRGKPLLGPSPIRCHGELFDCAHRQRAEIRGGDGRAEWSVGRRGDPAPRYRVLHLHSSGITLARRRAVWKDLHVVDICLL